MRSSCSRRIPVALARQEAHGHDGGRRRLARHFVVAASWLALLVSASSAKAQELSRIGLDSTIAIDRFVGQNAVGRPSIVIDISAVVNLGHGWQAIARPWIRQPRAPRWDKQIYQAFVQYERPGRIGTRLELGSIVSPLGLGMLDTRPGINPTIAGHTAYFTALPIFEPGGARTNAIASTYPLGGQLTLSGRRWDARGAVVASTPTRIFIINRPLNPKATPVVAAGAGVTPRQGLRIGAAVAHGAYATGQELTRPGPSGRDMLMATIEGEYAFGYTKLSAEIGRTTLDTAASSVQAYSWFVQGMHALSPRWFVAGRQEGVSAPPAVSGPTAGRRSALHSTEATVGFRLGRDLTARGSLLARKPFTSGAWDQQAGVSLVWARRWW